MSAMSEQELLEQRFAALQESLERRLAAVETENAELRAQLAERAEIHAPVSAWHAEATMSRRKALARIGGVAAAAGVAASAATLATHVPDARAADGNPVLLGQTNNETNQTIIQNDGTSNDPAALQVINNGHFMGGAFWGIRVTGPASGAAIFAEAPFSESDNVSSTGVYAISSEGVGVKGEATKGIGVIGVGSATGVLGAATAGVDLVASGTGRISQAQAIGHPGPPVPADGAFSPFEQIRDSAAMLWLRTPTRWIRPGVVNGGALGGAMNFLPSPVRLIGAGSPPGVTLAKNTRTNFTLAGSAGIPTDAKAVFGNVTVYGAGGSGFVTLTPKGGSASTSSLNFTGSDQPLSNFVAVGLNDFAITVVVSNNFDVKFIYDVVGYCL